MSQIWSSIPKHHYVSLASWCWVQLESAEPPGPFPFMGGIAPEVVNSLQEAHSLLSSAIDTAISDVRSMIPIVSAGWKMLMPSWSTRGLT